MTAGVPWVQQHSARCTSVWSEIQQQDALGLLSNGLSPGVEGEALLHMEELGNYTLKYLARRRTRKPPHDLVTGQTPDYMLSN